jgi:hypothetical protein
MTQDELEKKLLSELLTELVSIEARLKQVKTRFRNLDYHREISEAELSVWQAQNYVRDYREEI